MAWTLPSHEVQTFEQNTLAAVIVQLRFHPILKIAEHFPDFQDMVRPRFPGYEFIETQRLDLASTGVQVRNETAHRFCAAAEPAIVSLTTGSIAIEYTAHRHRNVLLADVDTVVSALGKVFGPVLPTRLGLRYVNLIQRDRVARELGRSVPWSELLTPNFAVVPGGIASMDEATTFGVEVSSPCSRGKMTVRYGLFATPNAVEIQQFRLDTDRYLEGAFDLAEVRDVLSGFSEDIFQVFTTAAGPSLLEWMALKGKTDG